MKDKKRQAFCIILLFLIVFIATGCPTAKDGNIIKEVELKRVVFGASESGVTGVANYIIKSRNLDEKNGINIEFKYYSPGDAAKAVMLKQVELGYISPVSAVRSNLEGKNIKIIGNYFSNHAHLIVPYDSDIKSIEQLKGKKLGVPPQYTGAYTSFATMLSLKDINLEEDFELVVGSTNVLIVYLLKGDVDAILSQEPHVSKLSAENKVRSITMLNEEWKKLTGTSMMMVGIAAYEDWIEENKDIAKAVVKTYEESFDYIRNNPSIFEEQAVKETLGVTRKEDVEFIKQNILPLYPEKAFLDEATIENTDLLLKLNQELGLLKDIPSESIYVRIGR